MVKTTLSILLPLLLVPATAGLASACPFHQAAAAQERLVVADNAATSTPAAPGKAPDAVAYPNSPNGSPVTTNKGAPVVTDKAACGTGPASTCAGSPAPSSKADTSDTEKGTPTTVNAKPATP